MAFFVYVAILLVAVSGILLELDWLTKPKLDTKSPLQTATAVLPAPEAAKPKIEKPNGDPAQNALNPVYPKKPDVARVVEPPPAQQRAETTGSAQPQPQPEAQPQQAQSQPQPQQPEQQAQTTVNAPASNPQAAKAAPPIQQQAAVSSAPSPAAAPAVAAPPTLATPASANKCDVHACAAAYASFRAEDCTYQPYEGPRRVCERPPAARNEQTARRRGTDGDVQTVRNRRSRDDELRDVEAAVRRLPARAARDDVDDDDDYGDYASGRRVIVIDRPWRRW